MKFKQKHSLRPSLAGLLALTLFACQSPVDSTTSEPRPQQALATESLPEEASLQTGAPSSESAEPNTQEIETANTPVQAKENGQAPCITWDEYQTAQSTSDNGLKMPPGFENGCVFRVGESRGSNINILSNDINLDTILDPDATEISSDPIPWFQGNQISSQYNEQTENGNIITYYQACTTIGGQESNCEGFPQNEAYVIDNNTACFQGQCLTVPDVHAIYLLSLWPWNEDSYGFPTSSSQNGTFSREQYRTVPLNQFTPGVPLVGRSREDIARAAYGRTTLEEGEQPTVITDAGWSIEDGISVVFLTNQGAADDSIGGLRYRLDFVGADGDQSKLVWIGQQQYCRRGENTGWTTKTCS